MRKILLFAMLTVALMATAQKKPMATDTTQRDPKFAKMAEQYMYDSLALSPVNASYAGHHKHTDPKTKKIIELDAILDDVSSKAYEEQVAFYKNWQKRFKSEVKVDSLNLQDQADWLLINDNIAFSLLQLEKIQDHRYKPTVFVELIGNALFLPLSQSYDSQEVRAGHVLSRVEQIPRFVEQVKKILVEADPIYIETAKLENEGNIDLIQTTVKEAIPAGSNLQAKYDKAVPKAIAALKDLTAWFDNDLAKRKTTRTWRLGPDLYQEKFRLVMQTPVTPEQVLDTAEKELKSTRAEMLEIALPMHKQMYPDHTDHSDLAEHQRENTIISETLAKVSDEHTQRDKLIDTVKGDIEGIRQFIRDKKIVALSDRENLKVIPTPPFMRGIYSVAGFASAPPLEPNAEAQYWVTPIDPKTPEDQAESKLREYNKYALLWLTIHEALPGHYIQFEHANSLQPEGRRVLRALFGNGAYVEGWAEYIAQVMMDEGFLDNNPKFHLVMRKLRLRLLANSILDVRMHTRNMTDEQAMDLMVKDCFQTQAEADGKLRRAKLSSTQVPTYYVGKKDWLQLRKDYQDAMGAKFNMAEFHNMVLDQGPVPIMYLRKIVMPQ
ncbi:MAG TPA: DUF885 domain-containing protein [Terriglobales bacterium]|nr:DUF885 domain-containing protein [Terriglobales bacterium]